MNLKLMSINDLKALAYDQIAQLEAIKNNLSLINNEIALRTSAPEKVEEAIVKQEPKKVKKDA